MRQGKGPWRKTIFRWLSAYALVVVLVVILVALISTVTLSTVENSARLEQQTKMENLRTSMDVMLVDVDRALTLIGADERLHVLGASTPPYTPFELYMLFDLNRSFSRQIAMQGPWTSIYVYVKKGGFILFNNGKFDLPSAYGLLDYGISIETWQEKLDLLKEKVFVSYPAASEPKRTYLEYWFPYGSGQESGGVLVGTFNILEFQNRLDAMRSFNDEILVLLDERGRVLLSTQPLDELLAQFLIQSDFDILQLCGKKWPAHWLRTFPDEWVDVCFYSPQRFLVFTFGLYQANRSRAVCVSPGCRIYSQYGSSFATLSCDKTFV